MSKEVYDEILLKRETNKLTKCEIEMHKRIQEDLQPPNSKNQQKIHKINPNCIRDKKNETESNIKPFSKPEF